MPQFAPLYFSLSDSPRAILQGIERTVERANQVEAQRARRSRLARWLFLAGIPCFLLDLILYFLGYPVCIFSFAGAAAWIGAIVARVVVGRKQTLQLPPRYETLRQVIHTLRDDQLPKKPLTGFIDLTGIRKDEKKLRTTQNALGLAVDHYQDEWLNLKFRLVDGNILRLSLIEVQKVRRGYNKRGASRMKWKPPKEKPSQNEIKLRLAVNADLYETANTSQALVSGGQLGPYLVEDFSFTDGLLSFSATTPPDIAASAEQILEVLRTVYAQLQRKGAPT